MSTFLDACYNDVSCTGSLLIFALPLAFVFAWFTVGRRQ